MKHFSEEDLIAYQLHESSDEVAISRHLESCSECADLSESIAETLRVFSADPVPQPDLERNWQRLRGNLSVLTPNVVGSFELLRWHWAWPAARRCHCGPGPAYWCLACTFIAPAKSRRNIAVNGHGPLTTEPADPAIANHLDAAERLLTEVNNSSGSLDDATREQAHNLLLTERRLCSQRERQWRSGGGCGAGEFWAGPDHARQRTPNAA